MTEKQQKKESVVSWGRQLPDVLKDVSVGAYLKRDSSPSGKWRF